MSWQAWFVIVVGIIAVLCALGTLVARAMDKDGDWPLGAGITGVAVVLCVVVLILGCFTIVGTRKVGIATSFGRPTGQTFEAGIHSKPFWVEVSEMDAAIQYSAYKREGDGGNPIKVRLGNNSIADADVSIRWRIQQDEADQLFMDYKTFDNVRTNLIERNLQVALNQVFQSFDPLSNEWSKGVPLQGFADDAAKKLREIVGKQAEILDISISKLDYDESTESKLNRQNEERANTAVALQEVETAKAKKAAAEERAKQVPPNLVTTVSNCINDLVEKGQNPAGCWGQIGGQPLIQLPAPTP